MGLAAVKIPMAARILVLGTVLVCALAFAAAEVGNEVLFEEDFEDQVLPGLASDINPEAAFLASEEKHGFKAGSRQKILASIVDLKAYCELAYDKAKSFESLHSSGNTALVNFVVNFGKKNSKPTNIVTGFAAALGQ